MSIVYTSGSSTSTPQIPLDVSLTFVHPPSQQQLTASHKRGSTELLTSDHPSAEVRIILVRLEREQRKAGWSMSDGKMTLQPIELKKIALEGSVKSLGQKTRTGARPALAPSPPIQ